MQGCMRTCNIFSWGKMLGHQNAIFLPTFSLTFNHSPLIHNLVLRPFKRLYVGLGSIFSNAFILVL